MIMATGRYTVVSSGGGGIPYISMNSNNPAQGMVRVQGNNMQIFDGSGWINMVQEISSVGLSPEAESLLDWARKKRDEEMAWQLLAEKNQAVKIALEKVEEATRQLDVTAKLAREYETTS
jgi:hypothetical protein